jgi:hypothetical protein
MEKKIYDTKFLLAILLLCVMHVSAFAQKAPIKYGKISKDDLEMKVYPSDTTALAAILCDYGYFNSSQFQFVRTLRIKIFKKEGTSWGNQVFPVYSRANIRGITYNLENGEIVESKLKPESIFRERVTDDYYRTRIAMPNVKEGSIIDIEFNYNGLPNEWRFQEEIPVRWSELVIESSPYVTFRQNFFGFERLSENTPTRWVAKDMPAFKKEPYMNSSKNYMTKYEIELLSISFPPSGGNSTGTYRDFSTTWEAVNNRLEEHSYFGKVLQGCAFLNNIAKEIEKKYTLPFDRLKAAHEAIKKAVKWNENESVFSSTENLSTAFNKKIGNSGDINLILIQLLKKLDFDVYPVALSTRSNGFLSPVSPSLDKLNYVVAYVLLDDKKYFLDATEEFLPVGMLPRRCINLQGRIIDIKKSEPVDLMTTKKDKKLIQFDMKLGTDNVLTGKISTINYDYGALDFRKEYEKFNSKEEYLKNYESEHKGLSVSNFDITNLDSIYLPLKESYEVKIKNIATTAGNLVYINPLLFEQLTSNPFKTEDRKYPVDFVTPSEIIYLFKLELPEGAQVAELPKSLSLKLEGGSATVLYQIATVGNFVQLSYKFVVNKAIFTELEYSNLRALYSEIVKKHAEQIVIKTL